jgi:hypothetical protein
VPVIQIDENQRKEKQQAGKAEEKRKTPPTTTTRRVVLNGKQIYKNVSSLNCIAQVLEKNGTQL